MLIESDSLTEPGESGTFDCAESVLLLGRSVRDNGGGSVAAIGLANAEASIGF